MEQSESSGNRSGTVIMKRRTYEFYWVAIKAADASRVFEFIKHYATPKAARDGMIAYRAHLPMDAKTTVYVVRTTVIEKMELNND